ncbi:MAG: hypothetical protein HYS09_06125 [Chloroflexi bacterium]|nr:hypothetical protein [Chloroflexota bacterium]
MNEEERADRLVRALDDLIEGREPDVADDAELAALLRIARIRRQAAMQAAAASAAHEQEVWELVVAKLQRRLRERDKEDEGNDPPMDPPPADPPPQSNGPPEFDSPELADVIALRRELAQRAASLSGDYRDEVWARVQDRLRSGKKKGEKGSRSRLPFFRKNKDAEELTEAVDRLILGEPVWEAPDSKLSGLMEVARTRRALGSALAESGRPMQNRLWARLRRRLSRQGNGRRQPKASRRQGRAWRKVLLVVFALADVALVVAPLPFTGLADHPIARLFSVIGL